MRKPQATPHTVVNQVTLHHTARTPRHALQCFASQRRPQKHVMRSTALALSLTLSLGLNLT
jgi:hypothetical protein